MSLRHPLITDSPPSSLPLSLAVGAVMLAASTQQARAMPAASSDDDLLISCPGCGHTAGSCRLRCRLPALDPELISRVAGCELAFFFFFLLCLLSAPANPPASPSCCLHAVLPDSRSRPGGAVTLTELPCVFDEGAAARADIHKSAPVCGGAFFLFFKLF